MSNYEIHLRMWSNVFRFFLSAISLHYGQGAASLTRSCQYIYFSVFPTDAHWETRNEVGYLSVFEHPVEFETSTLRFSWIALTLSWRRPLSYRNHSIDLLCKSIDWFLYENCLCHERVKYHYWSFYILSYIVIWWGREKNFSRK